MTSLQDFIPRLESLATHSFIDGVKREVANSCLREVDKCFRTETDPYGARWALRKKEVPWSILYMTGALHDSFVAYPTSTGVRFESSKVYAARQNYGGGGITARNMLPSASRGLPQRWTDIINRAFSGMVRGVLRAA